MKNLFLRYSTNELSMISGLFFCNPFVKILIFQFTISISRFRITEYFSEIFRKFLGKFLLSHIFTLPTPHNTHPHSIIQTVNSLRTSDPLFSKTHFQCICTFISHTLHIYTVYIFVYSYLSPILQQQIILFHVTHHVERIK